MATWAIESNGLPGFVVLGVTKAKTNMDYTVAQKLGVPWSNNEATVTLPPTTRFLYQEAWTGNYFFKDANQTIYRIDNKDVPQPKSAEVINEQSETAVRGAIETSGTTLKLIDSESIQPTGPTTQEMQYAIMANYNAYAQPPDVHYEIIEDNNAGLTLAELRQIYKSWSLLVSAFRKAYNWHTDAAIDDMRQWADAAKVGAATYSGGFAGFAAAAIAIGVANNITDEKLRQANVAKRDSVLHDVTIAICQMGLKLKGMGIIRNLYAVFGPNRDAEDFNGKAVVWDTSSYLLARETAGELFITPFVTEKYLRDNNGKVPSEVYKELFYVDFEVSARDSSRFPPEDDDHPAGSYVKNFKRVQRITASTEYIKEQTDILNSYAKVLRSQGVAAEDTEIYTGGGVIAVKPETVSSIQLSQLIKSSSAPKQSMANTQGSDGSTAAVVGAAVVAGILIL